MRACLDDLRGALAVAGLSRGVLELAAQPVEAELADGFDAAHAGRRLTAAYRRLALLPLPAGEHPFLDEILPTLEAMDVLLVAVSLVPEAAAVFEQQAEEGDVAGCGAAQ